MKLSAYEKTICNRIINSLDLDLNWNRDMIFNKVKDSILTIMGNSDTKMVNEVERYIRSENHIRKQDFMRFFTSLDEESRNQFVISARLSIISDCTDYCYMSVIVEKQDINVDVEYRDSSNAFANIARSANNLF